MIVFSEGGGRGLFRVWVFRFYLLCDVVVVGKVWVLGKGDFRFSSSWSLIVFFGTELGRRGGRSFWKLVMFVIRERSFILVFF